MKNKDFEIIIKKLEILKSKMDPSKEYKVKSYDDYITVEKMDIAINHARCKNRATNWKAAMISCNELWKQLTYTSRG